MSRSDREAEISDLCDQHQCKDKIRKIHFEQFVHRNWHPHPSMEFEQWWPTQPEYTQGVGVKPAFNCQMYRDRFLEAKQYAITEPPRSAFQAVMNEMKGDGL